MRHLVQLYLSKNIVETVPQITTDELNIINQMQLFKSSPNDLPPIVFQKLSTENKLVLNNFSMYAYYVRICQRNGKELC